MARIHLPEDLVQAQCDWKPTHAAPACPHSHNTTALRRRLPALSAALQWHSFRSTAPGGSPAPREASRHLARTRQQAAERVQAA